MSDAPQLPVFPLGTVLFPGGELSLRIFEPRYVDMVSRCGREGTGFVVAAIEQGREVGDPATPFNVGTEVHIVDWDQEDSGLLLIRCKGAHKVTITRSWVLEDGLRMGEVQRHAPEPALPVQAKDQHLWSVLERAGLQPEGPEQRNSAWLGGRLVECLPLELGLKQELLNLSDPCERLNEVNRLLLGFLRA